ncbi:MAG: hypothetical protein KDE50_19675 [Caldilineaceae bacterium]|nr:hypothetical protein [Caldilineaceae bacterium]
MDSDGWAGYNRGYKNAAPSTVRRTQRQQFAKGRKPIHEKILTQGLRKSSTVVEVMEETNFVRGYGGFTLIFGRSLFESAFIGVQLLFFIMDNQIQTASKLVNQIAS